MIAMALMTAATALPSGASFAANETINASRGQVEAACDANGGFSWGAGASGGRYGCMTDNAWSSATRKEAARAEPHPRRTG